MKTIIKVTGVFFLLLLTSCGSKKQASELVRDGSSFEKAIIANSISEEYAYVRKVCSDCKIQGQALVYEDKKPYDVLTLIKPDGEKVSYYFDISSFFGKW